MGKPIAPSSLLKPGALGYTEPVESTLRSLMHCMFPVTCSGYDDDACADVLSPWSGAVAGHVSFTERGAACKDGDYARR